MSTYNAATIAALQNLATSPASSTVTGATNATPIVVTTSAAHGFQTGQSVSISGVLGNTAANDTWSVTYLTTTTFALNGSKGNAAYTSGGSATGAALVAGEDAIVAGYAATGDLGGGTFYWEGTPPTGATVSGAVANNAVVSAASNAIPIQITTSVANTYVTGQAVLISGVVGNTAANGTWLITVTSTTTFTLNYSAGNGAYVSGGNVYTTTVTAGAAHGLTTAQQVMLAGVVGATSANGTWRATVLGGATFSIPSQLNAAYMSGGIIGDGGTSIPSAVASGRWRRVGAGPDAGKNCCELSARWFGAKGDGTTDDTTALQGALLALGQGYFTDVSGQVFGGGKLFIPSGVYKTTAPLAIPEGSINSNIVVEGAGQGNTIVRGYGYYPVFQSIWPANSTVSTFLGVRDLTIASGVMSAPPATWAASTAYSLGAVVTSGLSNRLLRCVAAGTSGGTRPFGQLWSGVLADPVVSITGNPTTACLQVIIVITNGGSLAGGGVTFEYSTDGFQSLSTSTTAAASVSLGNNLTANFSAGTYVTGHQYCSPPMGYCFSTVHDTTITDNTVQWAVIDGGCGILQFNGGELCIERVWFLDVLTGVIFDGTEVSVIRDCTFSCPNGIWLTGANQRLNNPATDPSNAIGISNMNAVEDCWFGCAQLSLASENNGGISMSGCNFEAGQWYGWTTAVTELRVFNTLAEGGYNGWFVGSLAPFNGNASAPITNGTFENVELNPNLGTGPAFQASNYTPASSGFQVLATPFLRLTFKNCYLATHGTYVFVGMQTGNGFRVIDTEWGGGTPFDPGSTLCLAEYSDSANTGAWFGRQGYGCVAQAGVDVNVPFALRSATLTLANGMNADVAPPTSPSLLVQGPTAAFQLAGVTPSIAGGLEGQEVRLIYTGSQVWTIKHQDTVDEATATSRIVCPTGVDLPLSVPSGGFAWVQLKYCTVGPFSGVNAARWLVTGSSAPPPSVGAQSSQASSTTSVSEFAIGRLSGNGAIVGAYYIPSAASTPATGSNSQALTINHYQSTGTLVGSAATGTLAHATPMTAFADFALTLSGTAANLAYADGDVLTAKTVLTGTVTLPAGQWVVVVVPD